MTATTLRRICTLVTAVALAVGCCDAGAGPDDHPAGRQPVRRRALVQQDPAQVRGADRKYYGKPVNFVLHRNSELGLEKDYFAYLSQGISVDYAIVSPSHMSTFAKSAPLMDMPFLFRDMDHWHKVLSTATRSSRSRTKCSRRPT